jgi:hypothetical protein
MRFDDAGLFWNDTKPPKPPKAEKIKRTPPDPVWNGPDYLPHFDEAQYWEPEVMSDEELLEAKRLGDRLVWDTESYPNYWSAGFTNIRTGKHLLFEDGREWGLSFDKRKLDWILRNFTLIDFKGEDYDRHTAAIAVKPGTDASHMYSATQQIIEFGVPGWMVVKQMGARKVQMDHIDLIELTPLAPSLKIMAGRLGSPLMMDLPFKPGTYLTWNQTRVLRWYMFNDNRNTELVYHAHEANIRLREEFGPKYGVDLRSRSDAQIAESIFRAEVRKRTGRDPKPIPFTGAFKFRMPDWVQFQTSELRALKQAVIEANFVVGETGYVQEPEAFKDLKIQIGSGLYTFGIGGLHSNEKSVAHCIFGRDGQRRYILRDHDVGSYYPKLILNSGYYPPAIGPIFTSIYQDIIDRRLKEKAIDPKGVWALGLKIVGNGTFGKTSDPFSVLYYPPLMVQTTISGQLALFMMIERAHLAGMEVTNANTDGVVIKCPVEQDEALKALTKDWERATGLEMETKDYVATFSRDVNSYIAIDTKYKAKRKGWYKENGCNGRPDNEQIKKNPTAEIVGDAIEEFLTHGTPIIKTITESRNINKFVTVKQAQGGGAFVEPGCAPVYLGKAVRFYKSAGSKGEIITVKKGHLVGGSEGCRPIMRYTETFPQDIDYEFYVQMAEEHLALLGFNALVN